MLPNRLVIYGAMAKSSSYRPWRRNLHLNNYIMHSGECLLGALRRPLWPKLLQPDGFGRSLQHIKKIHTTSPRYVNPMLVAVLRPLSKMLAVLVGRGFRKWWQSMPKQKRDLFIQHFIRNKFYYIGGSAVFGFVGHTYYESHVITTPFTKRRRFMIFNQDQLHTIAKQIYEEEMAQFGHQRLPQNHHMVDQVQRVGNRILQANNIIPQLYTKIWTVTVIDDPSDNCFVLPAEQLSHGYLLDILILVPLAVIWAFIPSDGLAVVTHWFLNKVTQILLHLPYSRTLEKEADSVGLQLAAKACYDVREASAFWGRMSVMDKLRKERGETGVNHAWLSTHPSHNNRQEMIDSQMSEAIILRHACQCPQLKSRDPRHSIWMLQKQLTQPSKNKQLKELPADDLKIIRKSTEAPKQNTESLVNQ
ncbi:metalloendopeptidase OMA1, mitochondrial isoform X2 [Procambarus clarkii]|uniref:metalloendopeptidase OMA1, mitochondrial isoform X2 n=1 Tax=Procambarus clarkii TaxID=6728 RepID=UPI0037437D6A